MGNHTVGTKGITAVLDLEQGAGPPRMPGGERQGAEDGGTVEGFRTAYRVREIPGYLQPVNQIELGTVVQDVGGQPLVDDPCRFELPVASGSNNGCIGIQPLRPPQQLPGLEGGSGGNGTAVHQVNVGWLTERDQPIAGLFQGLAEIDGFILIDLTSEGLEGNRPETVHRAPSRARPRIAGCGMPAAGCKADFPFSR